uniref:Heteropteran venom family 16 protein 1 n=1 Tax=Oncocephalus sp. TaxID=2944721 RepID=A0AB38ZEN8_9HEMI
MSIWFTLLLVCPLALSMPIEEDVDFTNMDPHQLTEHLAYKMQEHFGDNWKNRVPELQKKLEEIVNRKEQGLPIDSEEIAGSPKPWETAQTMLKWKHILHKIKHIGGKVIKGAAINIAGKAIAGAIAG